MEKGKIFISYRDSASQWETISVYYALQSVFKRDVFIDKFTLKSGNWKTKLLSAIETYRHFAVILSDGALNFENGRGQWFRREIRHAAKHGRNIVPVLFDDIDLNSPENRAKLSKYRLNILLEQQYVRISPNNFETDIVRLEQFLSGKENVIEKTLSKKDKKALSDVLRKEQKATIEKVPWLSNEKNSDAFNKLISLLKFDDSMSISSEAKETLEKQLEAFSEGTTPYLASSTDSLGISISEITSLKVGVHPVYDYPGETWVGLNISNEEDSEIFDCYVELMKVKEKTGKPRNITLPRLLGWSAAHESKNGYLNINRSSLRKIDVARTFSGRNKVGITGVNGETIHFLPHGEYIFEFQIGGKVKNIDKVPKPFVVGIIYSEKNELEIRI